MPVSVAARIFSRSSIGSFAIASRLPDSTVLNGSTFASSGFALTSAGTRSRQYITCEYIGCSTHSVPSWSKVAMRSAGGTNFGLPCVVVACTNSTIAFLAGAVVPRRQRIGLRVSRAPGRAAAPAARQRAAAIDVNRCGRLHGPLQSRTFVERKRAALSGRPLHVTLAASAPTSSRCPVVAVCFLTCSRTCVEVVARRVLQRRERPCRTRAPSATALADRQHVPVVDDRRCTGPPSAPPRPSSVFCVDADRLLERIALDVVDLGPVERDQRQDPARPAPGCDIV